MAKKKKKQPYTIQIDPRHEDKIKRYIHSVADKTGRRISHVATDLVLTGMDIKPIS